MTQLKHATTVTNPPKKKAQEYHMSGIAGLLDQARNTRLAARGLVTEVMSGAAERAQAATHNNDQLDHLLRTGSNPAELKAYYAQFKPQYEAAKARQDGLEVMAQRLGKMASDLAAAVNPKDVSIEQAVLGDEIKSATRTMGELVTAVRTAVLETSVAAALAGIQVPGTLIGAQAASAPHIILPAGFQLIHP
jgi:hypothetical protein